MATLNRDVREGTHARHGLIQKADGPRVDRTIRLKWEWAKLADGLDCLDGWIQSLNLGVTGNKDNG